MNASMGVVRAANVARGKGGFATCLEHIVAIPLHVSLSPLT